jgi:hypothetical protein
MMSEFIRGGSIAAACAGTACFALFAGPQLVPLIFCFLLAWLVWSLFRLGQEIVHGSHKLAAEPWNRECFFFWLGAAVSCFLAPIPFAIVGGVALHYLLH